MLEAGTQKRNGSTPSLSLEDDSNEPPPQTDECRQEENGDM
jgi:hypothetical protein